MLKLFEQIFRGNGTSAKGYPTELLKRATERAADATDPRVRAVPAYAKRLRPALEHAIDHVVRLVDSFPPPIPMSPASYSSEVVLSAMFSSSDSLRGCLMRDANLREFVATTPLIAAPVTALLIADPSDKRVFGHDTVGDKVISDAVLTVISFDDHRLAGPAPEDAETRRFLKWRAFDYLLLLALGAINRSQEQRKDLVSRRKLLQAKLDILSRSSGKVLEAPTLSERQNLQQRMDAVEAELREIGADHTVLERHLDLLCGVLATAEKQLWCDRQTLYIDPLNYLRTAEHPKAQALPIVKLRDANAREVAIQLVAIPPDCLKRTA